MSKFVSGDLNCKIHFDNVYVEEGQDIMDVLFPDGWEGEMDYNFENLKESEDNN